MAKKNGMKSQFLAKKDPEYKRVEQYRCSDIDFLSQLCHDAGLSLKCTDGKLVIFDQKEYEGKDSAWTVTKDDKSYIKWSHTLGPGRNAVCVLPGVLCWAERQAH